MIDHRGFIDTFGILFFSFFFLLFSVILFFSKKLTFGKRDITKIIFSCVVLVLLSLFLHYETPSGMNNYYGYGWPHDFYIVSKNFDKTESHIGLNLQYLFVNLIFYLSFLFFVFTVVKKRGKSNKG